jgi:hypothetical protein
MTKPEQIIIRHNDGTVGELITTHHPGSYHRKFELKECAPRVQLIAEALRDPKRSMSNIARHFKVSNQRVLQIARRFNIRPARSGKNAPK